MLPEDNRLHSLSNPWLVNLSARLFSVTIRTTCFASHSAKSSRWSHRSLACAEMGSAHSGRGASRRLASQHPPPRHCEHVGRQPFERAAGVQQQSGGGLLTV